MSDASKALELLRRKPEAACSNYSFKTGPKPGSWTTGEQDGGACLIACKKLATGIFELQAKFGAGSDYFYPWLQHGVGRVKVPVGVPEGTLVITGGVNGCSIVVSRDGGYYKFYHDGDSKYLTAGMIEGDVVARVGPKDYDPNNMGFQTFNSSLATQMMTGKSPKGDVSYGHFVVAVKEYRSFGIYSSGIMSLNGLKRLPMGMTSRITTF